MNLKNSILTAVAMAAIGLCLIGSGTYAYFSDTEETNNTFAAGLLDLEINKENIINVEKMVPGDSVNGEFQLLNEGNVDIKNIKLISSYVVNDYGAPNNGDDLGKYIEVQFKHHGKAVFNEPKTLAELQQTPEEIVGEFPVGSSPKEFSVEIEFINNENNQNHFQKDTIELNWNFEAVQRDGKTLE
ncbi:TasA family protein [Virgibacillus halodenitrificans]|uniref:TasA family protein n=1 Tax=Virgibacillus halodenitrificans TaxID=1482 RepID=UPI001F2746F0|nr:TasA family protein [Virgibacillus halodenitrificans]